ncbi:hypothetical protein [uncultured Draconibacterium sp.]|uniref:hypothetical protein n=1 Tax=uncultured Draconibacterium sp. TaxID=1573823 RepID=UPI002AA69BEE|nr:hypothetical protein [uncultured Draconibacterium sp.]
MKAFTKQIKWIFILFLSATIVSCSSSNKQNDNKEELAEDLHQVKQDVNAILEKDKEELKMEVDSAVTEFNEKLYVYEDELRRGTKQVSTETQDLVEKLKIKSDSLTAKVNTVQEQGAENWEEFKEELQYDTKNFKESVEAFFEDNK